MKQRWYDKDPTLSMAFSLLNNASSSDQELAAQYMFKIMDNMGLLDSTRLRTQEDRIRFLFPPFRRNNLEIHARSLVETIKHLNPQDQQTVAVQLINYIYILDCGMTDLTLEDNEFAEVLGQPESG